MSHGRLQEPLLARAASGPGASNSELEEGIPVWKLMAPVTLTLALCNMDRICLSVAMLPLAAELGWSCARQGFVQSAFLWGYTTMQLPGGWAADRFGGRRVLMGSTIVFSAATLLLPLAAVTPLTRSLGIVLPAVVCTRVLLGLGEGAAMPSMLSIVTSNVPPSKRATAIGIGYTGFQSGNLLGLMLTPWLIQVGGGWRAPFVVFGAAGALVLAVWVVMKMPPVSAGLDIIDDRHPDSKRREDAGGGTMGHATTPSRHHNIRKLLRSRAVQTILALNGINNWGYFLYLNWMPSFFYRTLGLDLRQSSLLSVLPWAIMAVGSSIVGRFADWLVASKGCPLRTVRRGMQAAAFAGPTVALCLLSALDGHVSVTVAALAFIVTLGMTSLAQAGFVAAAGDVVPGAAGTVFGLSNSVGCAAGVISTVLTGVVLGHTNSFTPIFLLTAGLNLGGIVLTLTGLQTDAEFP